MIARNRSIITTLNVVAILALSSAVYAQRVVLLVRHADTIVDSSSDDPPLTQVGERRAQRLATVLKDVGITAIYTSEFQRTRKTAEPIARALKISPISLTTADRDGLVKRIRNDNPEDGVLVIGHHSSIPVLLKLLGSPEDTTIAIDAFDALFIVVPGCTGPPSVLHLHY